MKNRGRRAFLTSFVCALCVILLTLAFCEVDAQSRRIGFGDEETLLKRLTEQTWELPWATEGR